MGNKVEKKDFFFSLCIPAYDYNGNGLNFLENNFIKFYNQKFQDFEVVVSDHSSENYIKDLCELWKNKFSIKWIRNENGRGFVSPNLNNAIKHANGKWIKIIFQDDFLFDDYSLQIQHDHITLKNQPDWIATRFVHSFDGVNFYRDFMPKWSDDIWTGNNTIGGPSVITIKKDSVVYFDEELNWLLDCDWYHKLFNKYGAPYILPEITMVSRSNADRLTNRITEIQKRTEYEKLKLIYA